MQPELLSQSRGRSLGVRRTSIGLVIDKGGILIIGRTNRILAHDVVGVAILETSLYEEGGIYSRESVQHFS